MKIATYNVNSIRRRLPIVLDWIAQHQPDVLCLQETKVEDQHFPLLELHAAGYHVTFRGRKAYKNVVEWGFTDVFRALHPDLVQYTYWDYFRNAFEHNWGWRIDHIMATAPLATMCRTAEVDLAPRMGSNASDHTIVWAEFDC